MREKRMKRSIVLTALLGALAALISFPPHSGGQEGKWKGQDPTELVGPKTDKPSTLRVMRFSDTVTGAVEDQGSVVGWSNRAATGTLEGRDKPQGTESIEVLKKGQAAAAAKGSSPKEE